MNRSSEVKRSTKNGKIKKIGTLLKLGTRGTKILQFYHLRSFACCKNIHNTISAKFFRILPNVTFPAETKEPQIL